MTTLAVKSDRDFLIVALDFSDQQEAKRLVESLNSEITFYKVGMQLFYSAGWPFIDYLRSKNKKIFLDLKINDIPNTVAHAIGEICRRNVEFLTLFTNADSVKAASQKVVELGSSLSLLNVSVLTSDDLGSQTSEKVKERTRLTLENGGSGVVCSGLETEMIRRQFQDCIIVNPGIRPKGFDSNDQKRIVTPLGALQNGASHIVVGRPITQSEDPRSVARSIWSDLG